MRKLATVSISVSAAIFAAHYLLPPGIWIYVGLICGLLSLTALFFKGSIRMRVLLICLSLSAGFFVCRISYSTKNEPARELDGAETEISAEVTDYPTETEEYSSVPIKLTDDSLPRLNAVLYSYDEPLPNLTPGDIISAQVRMKPADIRYGEEYDRYNADNVYVMCYLKGEIQLTGKSGFEFIYFPRTIASKIKEAAQSVFSERAAPFMTALLTGDKGLLYEDVQLYADMSEAGILHVVAVSGMHVAFLVGFIQLVIRRKRWASAVAIPLVWLFVPIAGASPSVIRAAFMQSMVLAAPLLGRENDGITSLTSVLAALLLINPAACASVSLQLSFAAMLGIVLASPGIYRYFDRLIKKKATHKKRKGGKLQMAGRKLLDAVFASLSATIGAMIFSTPIAAMHFGYMSIVGILVNILIFWLISSSFILGYISCFLGMLWLPLGKIMGFAASVLTEIIIAMVRGAAGVPYAAIYTEGSIFGFWLFLIYGIFTVCYIFRRRSGFRPVLPLCLSICSLCAAIILCEFSLNNSPGQVLAVDVGQGQSVIVTEGRATVVIDCGGKGKMKNAGDTVASRLLREGRRSIDVLALTHFDDDHVNGAIRLMSRVSVKLLVIPPDDFTRQVRNKIVSFAEECGTEVYIISEDKVLNIGDVGITAFAPVSKKESALMFLGEMEDFEFFITGDANAADERRFLKNHSLPNGELLVAGHHGSKHASSEDLINAFNGEYALISVGYNNYGHPTMETLSRFEKAGMTVLRTDEHGDIRFLPKLSDR